MNALLKLIQDNMEDLISDLLENIKREIKTNSVIKNENSFRDDLTELLKIAMYYNSINDDFLCISESDCEKIGIRLYDITKRNIEIVYADVVKYDFVFICIKVFRKCINKMIIKSSYCDELKIECMNLLLDISDNIDTVCWKRQRNIIQNDNKNSLLSMKVYNDFLGVIPDAVVVENNDGTILFANKVTAELFGVDEPNDLFGANKYKFVRAHPDYCAIMMQQDDRIHREKNVSLMERRYLRVKDGKQLILESTAKVIDIDDKEVVLYIIRDVEERKKIESLKEKIKEKTRLLKESKKHDKIKTEFFANISHELRTPLNVLLGALQLLELIDKKESQDCNKEKVRKYYNVMKQNCFRLVRLVNNLIDITKIDAGYFQFNPKVINIISIVEDIAMSVTGYAEIKGISLIFDTDTEEKIMYLDPDLIERIILNLLSNSIKFTDRGGQIFVYIYELENELAISVKDTGIGIPKEKLKDIFERFVQVDKSLSRSNEGSGIGLSLVKSLVEMQNGRIEIKSEYGKGSEIIVKFPVKELDENIKDEYSGNYIRENNIERINIEFSDIYS